VAEPLRHEITPKKHPHDRADRRGKTEIARRLARLADAPFIKVEATKFTEVGYVGRDVDTIVRDLVEISVKQTREQAMRKVKARAEDAAEERILDVLLPQARRSGHSMRWKRATAVAPESAEASATRQKFRKKLREGELDDKEIEIEVAATAAQMENFRSARDGGADLADPGHVPEYVRQPQKTRKLKIREALKLVAEEEAARMINDEDLKTHALANAEQNGIVFIDEIDKIASRSEVSGADVSRQGVQRDLLPLVEGTTVSTNTAWSRRTTSCSSPAARSTWPSLRT